MGAAVVPEVAALHEPGQTRVLLGHPSWPGMLTRPVGGFLGWHKCALFLGSQPLRDYILLSHRMRACLFQV